MRLVTKVLLFAGVFYVMLISWILTTFPMKDAETVVFTLQMPLDGFVSFFAKDAFFKVLIPAIVISLIMCCVSVFILKTTSARRIVYALLILTVLGQTVWLYEEVPIKDYIEVLNRDSRQPHHSKIMEECFYRISKDSVFFDSLQTKRNLILIIAESMENSFHEYVPELSKLANENLVFSNDGSFGGGIDVVGAKSTTSSTTSKISGFPMLTQLYTKLFPKIPTIYDILGNYGYTNYFLQGTSGEFGFGGNFLKEHGIDVFLDDDGLEKEGLVKYNNRITDKKMLEYAKNIVKKEREPFSLTIATIETHFPYGFYDEDCNEKPDDSSEKSRLKATLKCASSQIYDFISFVLNEEIGGRTEIVVLGDHLFKGKYIVEDFVGERSWLSIFINPIVGDNVNTHRRFTSIDIAPTLLESLGFVLPQHKMAFGTSLFSDSETLLEKIGKDSLDHEFEHLSTSIEYNKLILQN